MQGLKNSSEAELLDSLRTGDGLDEAVRAMYRNYFESLSSYILNNSGSRQDAEDIFQDVIMSFIDLVRNNKFRGDSQIKTFLYSMNRFAWLNELKKRGRAENREQLYEKEKNISDFQAAHLIEYKETSERISKLLDQVGETCKKILMLFYFENRSMKEILQEVKYENEQVVRNKKYKCLKQLESLISADPGLYEFLKNALHG